MTTIIDRLFDSVRERGHVCLGLDTDPSYLPPHYTRSGVSPAEAVLAFNRDLIEATADVVAVYKVQIAYYEALGLAGMRAYAGTLACLRERGALVIADVKRGDIAKTAEMYAKAHFTGDFEADFITVNPFMGMDTLTPFLPYLESGKKGLFALVATSNPGAGDIEGIVAGDGQTVSQKTGGMLSRLGEGLCGACGYSALGAVVGCTNRDQTEDIRRRLQNTFFLIPGYGAQGGAARDIVPYLKNGNGGVVNSSRGILLAWKKPENEGLSASEAARRESVAMRDAIRHAIDKEH